MFVTSDHEPFRRIPHRSFNREDDLVEEKLLQPNAGLLSLNGLFHPACQARAVS